MSAADEFLQANLRFAQTFSHGHLTAPPARRAVVLTCMDARMDPFRFLGLDLGDAHFIRNAGGLATDDALRSLVISSHLLGTREFVVIHHTDCGMLTFTDEQLRRKLADELGVDASGIDFLPFSDLEESVRADVHRIRASPLLPVDISVSGFVYDVRTGALQPVAADPVPDG